MPSLDPAPETRASRRAQHAAPHWQRVHQPLVVPLRPRPVLAAGSLVTGLVLAVAALTASVGLLVGVVAAAGLLVAVGLPHLARLASPVPSAVVLALTAAGLAAARLWKDEDPLLEVAPVAAGAGIVLMCLAPLVSARVRSELTVWLTATSLGIGVLLCGSVLTVVLTEGRRPLVVAGVAIAVSALTDLALERPRLDPWMLPAAMLTGGVVGLVTAFVLTDQLLLWALLVGVLASGIALAVRRLATALPTIDEPLPSMAAGAAAVLVVGPVVLTLARVFIG